MAEDYNGQQRVVEFIKMNTVGVRVGHGSKAGKRRQARGTDNLPGIVVAVHSHAVGDSGPSQPQVQHKQYTVLTEFGVLHGTWKIDELMPISLNNFPQLITLMSDMPVEERMSTAHRDGRDIDLTRDPRIGIDDAWTQHRLKRKPATKSAARPRTAPARAVVVAAETAIVASRVDRRRAPSLLTVSSQPASTPQRRRHQLTL